MMNAITILLLIVFAITGCKIAGQEDAYKQMATDLLLALRERDLTKVYSLIDTTRYFNLKSKESLVGISDFLNNRLRNKICSISDSSIKIVKDNYLLQYVFQFCRDKNGLRQSQSFNLVFDILLYNDKKISNVEITELELSGKEVPAPPIKKSN